MKLPPSRLSSFVALSAVLLATGFRGAHAYPVLATIPLNGSPGPCAVNSVTHRLYIADSVRNVVFVLDASKNTFLATIPVDSEPLGVAVDESRNLVYVANHATNSVAIIDGATNLVSKNVTLNWKPIGIAVDPSANMIYTANGQAATITVVDGSSLKDVDIHFSAGSNISAIAVNPVTGTVFVTDTFHGMLGLVDGSQKQITGTFPVPNAAILSAVAVDSVKNRVYVADFMLSQVTVADGEVINSLDILATIPTGSGPIALAVNETTGRVYSANKGGNSVTVIDADASSLTINVGTGPLGIAADAAAGRIYEVNGTSHDYYGIDGDSNNTTGPVSLRTVPAGVVIYGGSSPFLFVASLNTKSVIVIDPINFKVLTTIPAGTEPYGVATSGFFLYVTNTRDNTVSLVDIGSLKVAATIAVGVFPSAVAVDENASLAYVTNAADDTVSVIDEASKKVSDVFPAGTHPVSVAVDPGTHQICVANLASTTLAIFDGVKDELTGAILFSGGPTAVALDPYQIWVVENSIDLVTALDANNPSQILGKFNAGGDPQQLALNGLVPSLYVVCGAQETLQAFSRQSFKFVSNAKVGSSPRGVAAWPSHGYIYVTNAGSDTVTVIRDPTPINLKTPGDSHSKGMSWHSNSPNDSYQLQRADCATCDWAPLAELPPGQTEYEDLSALAGKLYYYRVRALYQTETGRREPSDWSLVASTPAVNFLRGEANGDGKVDLADPIALIQFLFAGAGQLPCPEAADADDNGNLEITDPIYLLGWLFLGGPQPPAPGPRVCGADPTPDDLEAAYGPCQVQCR